MPGRKSCKKSLRNLRAEGSGSKYTSSSKNASRFCSFVWLLFVGLVAWLLFVGLFVCRGLFACVFACLFVVVCLSWFVCLGPCLFVVVCSFVQGGFGSFVPDPPAGGFGGFMPDICSQICSKIYPKIIENASKLNPRAPLGRGLGT